MTKEEIIHRLQYARHRIDNVTYAPDVLKAIDIAIEAVGNTDADTISRQAAIDALCSVCGKACDKSEFVYNAPQDEQVILCPEHYCLCTLPSAQPEIIRCKDCEYGEQDEVGRWFCRSLGCQIGNEEGSGYCADAERRTDG